MSSLTLGQAKDKAIKLLRLYSNGGVVIPTNDNLDYTLSMNQFADTAQREVAKYAKIHATYSISRNPIDELFGDFDLYQYLPTGDDLVDAQGINAQSYYFEVDRPCSVVIEESTDQVTWSTLSTLTITSITSFTAYSGFITPSLSTNYVRLRFTGTYPFNRRHTALWDMLFATSSDIPIYAPQVKYTLPSDFYKLNKIIWKTNSSVWEQNPKYRWVNKKDLYIDYDYKGSFDITYYAYPTRITDATSDSYTFDVYDEAADAIPYYMAAYSIIDEMPSLGNFLLAEYDKRLMNLETLDTDGVVGINKISGW